MAKFSPLVVHLATRKSFPTSVIASQKDQVASILKPGLSRTDMVTRPRTFSVQAMEHTFGATIGWAEIENTSRTHALILQDATDTR